MISITIITPMITIKEVIHSTLEHWPQGCIFRLMCSYPELTEDHVLTRYFITSPILTKIVSKSRVNRGKQVTSTDVMELLQKCLLKKGQTIFFIIVGFQPRGRKDFFDARWLEIDKKTSNSSVGPPSALNRKQPKCIDFATCFGLSRSFSSMN